MKCDLVGFECVTHDCDVAVCIERLETESTMMQQVNREVRAIVGARAGEGTADAVKRVVIDEKNTLHEEWRRL
jgi:hypothetical protein